MSVYDLYELYELYDLYEGLELSSKDRELLRTVKELLLNQRCHFFFKTPQYPREI